MPKARPALLPALWALCLALPLAGCATVEQPGAAAPTPPPVEITDAAGEPGRPAPVWGEQVYMTAYAVEGRAQPVFSPEYRLPRIENAQGVPGYEALNAYYAAALEDLAVAAAELSGWAVDDYRTTQATGEPFYPYTDAERYVLSLEAPEVVSILRTHTSAAGSPQAVTYPVGDTFDLATGARLTFGALFSCPREEAAARVWAALEAQNEAGAYQGAPLDAEALKGAFEPEQFYLTESALTIFYPAGDIPGALGSPTFAIPYEDLADIWALPLW